MSDAQAASVNENGVPPTAQENSVQEAPGYKVFAGNLAYTTTDDGLKAFFAPVQSDIISAQVILRGHRSAGYGFVALSSAEAAQKAVDALHQQELDSRQVVVEIAKPADQKDKEKKEKRFKSKRRPSRRDSKGAPGELSEDDANTAGLAEGTTDEAANLKKRRKKRSPKPKSDAAGTSKEPAAPPADGEAPSRPSRVRKPREPRPPRPAGEDPAGEPSKTMLFVANLGFNVDDAALAALFTEAGINVVSARIVRRRYGQPRKSKGYGFVDVGGEAEQVKAIQALEGKDVGGRPIAVKVAVNTPHDDANDPQPNEVAPGTAA